MPCQPTDEYQEQWYCDGGAWMKQLYQQYLCADELSGALYNWIEWRPAGEPVNTGDPCSGEDIEITPTGRTQTAVLAGQAVPQAEFEYEASVNGKSEQWLEWHNQ